MKLNLLPFFILHGFVLVVQSVQPVAPTLYFITQNMTWPNARRFCKANYTDLAPVKTSSDVLKIEQITVTQNWSSPIWIGLYNDINSWRWSYHDVPLSSLPFLKWNSGEPNNNAGIEQCGSMRLSGFWNDLPCYKLKSTICYNAKYPGDSRFVGIVSPIMNFTNAQTYCRRFHTDLATSLDETENSIIQKVVAAQGDSWIGLYRDGWFWSDLSKALNIFWTPGQPDNYYGNENCGVFSQGALNDTSCNDQYAFVCHHTPPIKRKVLKLQVKSDQNVFNASVQSFAILAKMVQKLQEHGMSTNITVTWRLQPDGNIFHKKNDHLQLEQLSSCRKVF